MNKILIGALILAVLGGGAWMLLHVDKKDWLVDWGQKMLTKDTDKIAWQFMLDHMTKAEINAVYEFLHDYNETGKLVPVGSPLYLQIAAISEKYNIFT